MPSDLARSFEALRTAALAYPESHEDHPWGHSAIKIKTKVFVFLHHEPNTQVSLSTKLPRSSEVALLLPFAKPTGYGLARSGWVTAAFGPRDEVPVDLLRSWIDESFRAIAPAKLVRQLGGGEDTSPTEPATSEKPAAKKTAAKKPAAKKPAGKPAAKKPAASKTAAKKPAASKTAAKRTASSKTAAKRTAASKTAAKRTAASKTAAKRTASPSRTASKAAAKKSA